MRSFLLAAVFPNRCKYCGDCGALVGTTQTLCPSCQTNLPHILPEICLFCGYQKTDCICKQRKMQYQAICAPFYYTGAVERAVHRYKFSDKPFLAEIYAEDVAATVRREYAAVQFDVVTFVPFTDKQMKQREWNPGETLARAVAAVLQLPCEPLLCKLCETKTQHSLGSRERTGNVFGAFEVSASADLQGKTVLLVDDIKTTGATLSECAKMLRLGGAKAVYAAAFAVTKCKTRGKASENG